MRAGRGPPRWWPAVLVLAACALWPALVALGSSPPQLFGLLLRTQPRLGPAFRPCLPPDDEQQHTAAGNAAKSKPIKAQPNASVEPWTWDVGPVPPGGRLGVGLRRLACVKAGVDIAGGRGSVRARGHWWGGLGKLLHVGVVWVPEDKVAGNETTFAWRQEGGPDTPAECADALGCGDGNDDGFRAAWERATRDLTQQLAWAPPGETAELLSTFRECGFLVARLTVLAPSPSPTSPATNNTNATVAPHCSSSCLLPALQASRNLPIIVISNNPTEARRMVEREGGHPNVIALTQPATAVGALSVAALMRQSRGVIWDVAPPSMPAEWNHDLDIAHLLALFPATAAALTVILTNQAVAWRPEFNSSLNLNFLSCACPVAVDPTEYNLAPSPPRLNTTTTTTTTTTSNVPTTTSCEDGGSTAWLDRERPIVRLDTSDIPTVLCAARAIVTMHKTAVLVRGGRLPVVLPMVQYDVDAEQGDHPVIRPRHAQQQPTHIWEGCRERFQCWTGYLSRLKNRDRMFRSLSMRRVARSMHIDLNAISARDGMLVKSFRECGFVVVLVRARGPAGDDDCMVQHVLPGLRDIPVVVTGYNATAVQAAVKALDVKVDHPNVHVLRRRTESGDPLLLLLRDMAVLMGSRGVVVWGDPHTPFEEEPSLADLVFLARARDVGVYMSPQTAMTWGAGVTPDMTEALAGSMSSSAIPSCDVEGARTFHDQVLAPGVDLAAALAREDDGLCPGNHFEFQPSDSVWLQPQHRVVSFTRELGTGLGDRLTVLLCVASAAHALEKVAVTRWYEGTAYPYHLRYAWATVRQFLVFPESLKILNDPENQAQYQATAEIKASPPDYFARRSAAEARGVDVKGDKYLPSNHGIDSVYCLPTYWCLLDLDDGEFARDKFPASYRLVGRQFDVRLDLLAPHDLSLLHTLACGFLVLHIRLFDKDLGSSKQFCTVPALAQLRDIPVLVVSDEPIRALRVVHEANHPNIRALTRVVDPDLPLNTLESNTRTALRDLGVMLRARGILMHSVDGWSAYSVFPALARGLPILSTWQEASHGMWQDMKTRTGGLPPPPNLFQCSGSEASIEEFRAALFR